MTFQKSIPAVSKASVRIGPGDTQFTVQLYFGGDSFTHTLVKLPTMALLPDRLVGIVMPSFAEMLEMLIIRDP